jgi:hypothetical protein
VLGFRAGESATRKAAVLHIHPYKWVLLVGWLATPFLILTAGNRFTSSWRTLLRFVLAVAAGWAWLLASTFVVATVDQWLASSPEEVERIINGDGAKFAAVLLFGWVPALAIAIGCWLVGRVVFTVRRRGARVA